MTNATAGGDIGPPDSLCLVLNNPGARKAVAGVIEPIARGLLRIGVTPDAVTIVGTVAAVAVALATLPSGNFILGVVLLAVIALSDLIDGTMARLSGTSGPWGNFLDATLDRLADGAIFGGLAMYGVLHDEPLVAGGALLALVTGQVTSYAKARAEAVGATANVGIAERAERLLIAAAGVLLAGLGVPVALPIALWLLGALGLVTIVQRIVVVRAQLEQ